MSECAKCKLKKKDNLVGCEGSCAKWFHTSCVNLNENEFKLLDKCHNLFYMCDSCKINCAIVNKPVNDKLLSNIDKINSNLSKILSDEIQRKLFDELSSNLAQKIDTAVGALRDNLSNLITGELENIVKRIVPEYKEPTATYASITRPKSSLILQPKNTTQSTTTTKSEILHTIDPINSNINISDVKNARNGALVISCVDPEESTKFKDMATKQLGEKYNVKQLPSLNPRIRIANMTEMYSEDVLLKYIKTQNKLCFLENSVCEIVYVKSQRKNKRMYQAVLQVDIDTYHRVLKAGKLAIGLDFDCSVFCAIELRRCFKCCGYHHLVKQCTKESPTCPKCSENHYLKDCSSQHVKCVHCSNLNSSLNLKINIDHSTWDPDCYVYKKTLDKFKAKILNLQ